MEMSGETHLCMSSAKLLEVGLHLSATSPFVRQQREGGKEISLRIWEYLASDCVDSTKS